MESQSGVIKGGSMKKRKGRIGYCMEETAKTYGFEIIETELDPGIEVIARRSSTQIQLSPELRNNPVKREFLIAWMMTHHILEMWDWNNQEKVTALSFVNEMLETAWGTESSSLMEELNKEVDLIKCGLVVTLKGGS